MSVLETPVELLQREDEFVDLLEVYRQRKPGRVLEIGTHRGGSLYHWLRNAPPGTTVVSVDTGMPDVDAPSWAPDEVELVTICGDSNDADTARLAAHHGPFDWIYIDAGHYENEVRADWLNYGPMCAPDGVVVFHDISRDDAYPHIQVWRLWAELREQYEVVTFGVDTGVVYP